MNGVTWTLGTIGALAALQLGRAVRSGSSVRLGPLFDSLRVPTWKDVWTLAPQAMEPENDPFPIYGSAEGPEEQERWVLYAFDLRQRPIRWLTIRCPQIHPDCGNAELTTHVGGDGRARAELDRLASLYGGTIFQHEDAATDWDLLPEVARREIYRYWVTPPSAGSRGQGRTANGFAEAYKRGAKRKSGSSVRLGPLLPGRMKDRIRARTRALLGVLPDPPRNFREPFPEPRLPRPRALSPWTLDRARDEGLEVAKASGYLTWWFVRPSGRLDPDVLVELAIGIAEPGGNSVTWTGQALPEIHDYHRLFDSVGLGRLGATIKATSHKTNRTDEGVQVELAEALKRGLASGWGSAVRLGPLLSKARSSDDRWVIQIPIGPEDFRRGYCDSETVLPKGTRIGDVRVDVIEGFDGNAALTIGTPADRRRLMTEAESFLPAVGDYEVAPPMLQRLTAASPIRVTLTGDPTRGRARVSLVAWDPRATGSAVRLGPLLSETDPKAKLRRQLARTRALLGPMPGPPSVDHRVPKTLPKVTHVLTEGTILEANFDALLRAQKFGRIAWWKAMPAGRRLAGAVDLELAIGLVEPGGNSVTFFGRAPADRRHDTSFLFEAVGLPALGALIGSEPQAGAFDEAVQAMMAQAMVRELAAADLLPKRGSRRRKDERRKDERKGSFVRLGPLLTSERHGPLEGWRTTTGGYQVTTIGGQQYLTLFDLREPPLGAGSWQDALNKEVAYEVGPVPKGWTLPFAKILRVINGPGPTWTSSTDHYWDNGELALGIGWPPALGKRSSSHHVFGFDLMGDQFDRAVNPLSDRLWHSLEVQGRRVTAGFPDTTRLVDRSAVRLHVSHPTVNRNVDGKGTDEYGYHVAATFPPAARGPR